MYQIKQLSVGDAVGYKREIVRFIYESVKNTSYEESYLYADAEAKYEELLAHMEEGNAIVCGAAAGDELIGFIWGYEYPFRDDKSRLYVSILHVDERFRGCGAGRSLLAEIEESAKKKGCRSVFLHAEAFNTGAIRFYERMGFQAERIQLVKPEMSGDRAENGNEPEMASKKAGGGVKRLTSQQASEYREELAELFLMNTKAHILTQSADYHSASVKIAELAGYIRQGRAVAYGYFDERKLVGFIWVFPYPYKREERYFLNAVTVLPEYRGKQIAGKLMKSVENELCCKHKALFTCVDAVNEKGRGLYRKHGMKEEAYQLVKRIG